MSVLDKWHFRHFFHVTEKFFSHTSSKILVTSNKILCAVWHGESEEVWSLKSLSNFIVVTGFAEHAK